MQSFFVLINLILFTLTTALPGGNALQSASKILDKAAGILESASKNGGKKWRPLERTRSRERARSLQELTSLGVKKVRFKPEIPTERVALIYRSKKSGDVSFQLNRNKKDVVIGLEELERFSPYSYKIMKEYELDPSDSEAIDRAFKRVKSGTSSGPYLGDPKTISSERKTLTPTLKLKEEEIPTKNEEGAQKAFYGSLRRALKKLDRNSYRKDEKFARDEKDREAANDLFDLGDQLYKKYDSRRRRFTDRDERKLKYLLDENGYQPLRAHQ